MSSINCYLKAPWATVTKCIFQALRCDGDGDGDGDGVDSDDDEGDASVGGWVVTISEVEPRWRRLCHSKPSPS